MRPGLRGIIVLVVAQVLACHGSSEIDQDDVDDIGGVGGTTSMGGNRTGGQGETSGGDSLGGISGAAGIGPLSGSKGGIDAGAPSGSTGGAGGGGDGPIDLAEARMHPFLEVGGKVVMEAEHGVPVTRGDIFPWVMKAEYPAFSGTGYMVAHAPGIEKGDPRRIGSPPESQAMLVFFVDFKTIGTFRLWAWRYFPDNGADSYYWQLENGSYQTAADNHGYGSWQWSNTFAGFASFGSFKVEMPGVREIRIIRREANAAIDRLFITNDNAKLDGMSGPGGAESPRAQ